VQARLLILLTEVEGVYSQAPGSPGAELIPEGSAARAAALGDASPTGKGGMRSKVLAAEMAASAGIHTVIAGGAGEAVLEPIVAGEARGTVFEPRGQEHSAFKLWLVVEGIHVTHTTGTKNLDHPSSLRRVMGDELYRSYIDLKNSEWWSYHNSISQWEIDEYLTKF